MDINEHVVVDEMCEQVSSGNLFTSEYTTTTALLAGDDALEDNVVDLEQYAEVALLEDYAESDDDNGLGGRAAGSAWYRARFELVHDGKDLATSITVLQAAFHHVEAVHRGSTIAQVEMDIMRALAEYAPECGDAAPHNPRCRYPPSYYLCKVICAVGDLSQSEMHLCGREGCEYMTVFPKLPRDELLAHIHGCSASACRVCVCPCGGTRMADVQPGCTPQPLAPCYFFEDVFQQFFLDTEWYDIATNSHHLQAGTFFTSPEGIRIMDMFQRAGVDVSSVRSDDAGLCATLTLLTHPSMQEGGIPHAGGL